ncbi:hypothetical protein E2562_028633 [Oryza meyeriana var. granulata]|uniref:Thaumatin-like protein n=1 Tax=Oryza meyeriana var. granulata TaxID=110450 RepID=A0A6G1FCV9_9ORYZ|nr:hypothetical protein E2562_028633 [Oryza meyeriana var. granulata]
MASPTTSVITSSMVLLLQLVATFTAGAGAATITIVNNCSFTVCPGALPIGGGEELTQAESWTLNVPPGASGVTVWPRTGCSLSRSGITVFASCESGDCGGRLNCTMPGTPPVTVAEFAVGLPGATDQYGISVANGFNVPMALSCSSGGRTLQCKEINCADGEHRPHEPGKIQTCRGNSDYRVVFCPV